MRRIQCDRCGKILEHKRTVRTVTCSLPLSIGNDSPAPANDSQRNEILWTKELCGECSDALDAFMVDKTAGEEDGGGEEPVTP